MNKSFRRFLALSLFCSSWMLPNAPSLHAEDTARQLAAHTAKMNDWLAPSAQAKEWRIFLNLNSLETLVGRGYRADAAQLREISNRFQQLGPTQHSNFSAVADAIQAHADQIQAANQSFPANEYSAENLDAWRQAFEASVEQLSTMSSAQLNSARLKTMQEVSNLDQFLLERGPMPADQLVQPLEIIPSAESEDTEDEDSDSEDKLVASNGAFDLARTIQLLSQEIELDWEDSEATEDSEDESEEQMSIAEIRQGLRADVEKLEQYAKRDPNPYVSSALMRLQDYELKLNLGSRENLPRLLGVQVERLVEGLSEWKLDGDRLKQTEVVRILGLLEATEQSPALIAAFKRTFWRNNAMFTVSESLVNRFASRPVQDTSPVNEVILDNQVCGTATTNGQVQIDFVPNDSQAHFSLHLTGTVNADNYSPVGPITVYSGSQAQIEARRSIYLNGGGWFEKAPYGSTNLQSFFKGTSCGRLIEQLAAKQFENQRDGAQRVGARRAQNRMLTQFSQETTEALTNGRAQMQEQRSQANAIKPYRPVFYVLTSEHFLHGFANRYGDSQMAAMSTAPAMTVPSDVAFQIHDSLLNNYLEDELGGLTLTDEDLDRINANAEANVPDGPVLRSISDDSDDAGTDENENEDTVADQRDPFELILDTARPIDVHFADQLVYVTVNVRRFQSQGQSISDVQVKTRFKMHQDSENGVPGIRIEQLGDIKAVLKDPDDIELDSATILNLIETTINQEIARQRTDSDQRGIWLPLNLIDRSKIPALAGVDGAEILDQARLVTASFQDGWASFAWSVENAMPTIYSLSDHGVSVATPTSLPAIATEAEFEALSDSATSVMETDDEDSAEDSE